MVYRIYVEKKPGFDGEAQGLLHELVDLVGIQNLTGLRLLNRYDVEGIDAVLFQQAVPTVFSEPPVDVTYDKLPDTKTVFAVEYLPGQFDQRADSASECIQLLSQGERPAVRSARVYLLDGDLTDAVNEGVRRGYEKAFLRKSITADPLQRVNTGDNTPAFLTVHLVPGDGCQITVAPKGAGSENMSRLTMLKPADGVQGVKNFVLDTVKQAGANPCPPIVLGIGVGGSFDKVAYLAKKALLRPLDVPNPDPYYAGLERELLTAINELGIGPQGFGGKTTAIGLNIETMPTHIAGMPCAVNINCHVTRHKTEVL